MIYREGFHLPYGETMEILKHCEAMITEVDTTVRKLNRASASAKTSVEIEYDALDHDGLNSDDPCFTRAVPVFENLLSAMRSCALSLYKSASQAPDLRSEDAEDADGNASDDSGKIVEVHLENDAIFIRLPMLWSKYSCRKTTGNRRPIGPERATFFREELSKTITENERFEAYDFGKFATKIVHFLYVYESAPTNKLFMTDNDNHETKYIQDAVTMYLPGGDSPLSCATFSSAAVSNQIPEGTYITITRQSDGVKSAAEIEGFWNRVLQ